MQSTQEIAELMLDANRNTLLGLDLKVSIATLGVGIGAMTAGVFGMNVSFEVEVVQVVGRKLIRTPGYVPVDISLRARCLGVLHCHRKCCCCVYTG